MSKRQSHRTRPIAAPSLRDYAVICRQMAFVAGDAWARDKLFALAAEMDARAAREEQRAAPHGADRELPVPDAPTRAARPLAPAFQIRPPGSFVLETLSRRPSPRFRRAPAAKSDA